MHTCKQACHVFHAPCVQEGTTGLTFSSGWASLDEYYKVVPGEVTVVTGGFRPNVDHAPESTLSALLLGAVATHHKTLFVSHRPTGQLCHAVRIVDAVTEHFVQ